MTFLEPVAGLIAAGLSVPAVLLLYFLKLRRQPLRVSSTLLWQRAVHDVQVNAPFRWLRLSWLLLLQLLIALLISGAIARPALHGAAPLSGRVVIVIDRSASMNALDGRIDDERRLARLRGSDGTNRPASRLEQAKVDALALIDRLSGSAVGQGSVQVSVAAWAAQARRLTSFTEDETAMREAVASVTPTDQPQSTAELIRLLEALGAASTDEESSPRRTRVFLFSDGGGFADQPGLVINAPVDITYVRMGAASPTPTAATQAASADEQDDAAASTLAYNIGIVAISARRDHQDPTLARIFVRLVSTAPQPTRATLQLRVDERLEQVAAVQLSAATPEGPGEGTGTFDLVNTRGGVVTVTRAGGSDLLEVDDGAAIVLRPPRRPSVLVVAPGEDGAEADDFLMGALRVIPLQTIEQADEQDYAALLNAGGIARFDLVVFDRISPSFPPPCASIHVGSDPNVPGVAMTPLEEAGEDGRAPTWTRVLMWERTHPIMRYVSLDNFIVAPPMRLTLPGGQSPDSENGSPPVRTTVLATGSTGPLMALVSHRGIDRLLLAFAMERTNWGPEASWLIFLANAVDVLTMGSEAMTGSAHTTAEPVRIEPEVNAAEIALSGPLNLTYSLAADRRGGGPVSLGMLERAGVYRVSGAANLRQLAVNLADEGESRATVQPEIRISGRDAAGTAVKEAAPREVWHWLVLAAIGLLGIEWLLYAWRMRL